MKLLVRIFGWPHELLHALALRLIGRRAVAVTQTHVDIPDDLTTGEYVFVAGLPALVFWGGTALGVNRLFDATDLPRLALWFALTMIFMLAGIGTLGDLLLIVVRITEDRTRPPSEG